MHIYLNIYHLYLLESSVLQRQMILQVAITDFVFAKDSFISESRDWIVFNGFPYSVLAPVTVSIYWFL